MEAGCQSAQAEGVGVSDAHAVQEACNRRTDAAAG